MKRALTFMLVALSAGCYSSYRLEGLHDASPDPVPDPVPELIPDPDVDPDPEPDPDPVIEDVDEETCATSVFSPWRVAPDVLILLDRSNSMNDTPPFPPMWDTIRTALIDLSEPPRDSEIWFGLMSLPGSACTGGSDPEIDCLAPGPSEVLVGVGSGNHALLESTLEGLGTCGGTPVAETLRSARSYLSSLPDHHPRYVLLATDGAPNCNMSLDGSTCRCTSYAGCTVMTPWNCLDELVTYDVLDELCAASVHTFILGLGSSTDWSDVYSGMAEHGCTESYYLAEDLDEIGAALEDIAGLVASCQIELGCSDLTDAAEVNFFTEPGHVLVPRDPGRAHGWDWMDPCDGGPYGLVEFFGIDCEALFADDLARFVAETGCPTITI